MMINNDDVQLISLIIDEKDVCVWFISISAKKNKTMKGVLLVNQPVVTWEPVCVTVYLN